MNLFAKVLVTACAVTAFQANFAFAETQQASHQSEQALASIETPASVELLRTYRRLLPLEGSSNFRDLGGYPTVDGHTVKRGLLFRSGAMTSLTASDIEYLDQFGFQSIVDLRSDDEIELYPNVWLKSADLKYRSVGYSMKDFMKTAATQKASKPGDYSGMYTHMPESLKPHLKMYFETVLNAEVPAVVNCSAGQDRTGMTSALMLSALGVDRELVVEDYLLSTDFRRPLNEKGDVNLAEAAETNAFAKMMLAYDNRPHPERPNSLITEDGKPFIEFALGKIDAEYGSVESYLKAEIGLSDGDIAKLKAFYLE